MLKGNINLDQIKSITSGPLNIPKKQDVGPGPSFGEVLKNNTTDPTQALANKVETASALKFSNHAIDRIRSRGINMGAERMQKVEQAVDKAAQKGAKETLVMMGDSALIVSVKNKTVITALDTKMMKENVFTNIDSTVII